MNRHTKINIFIWLPLLLGATALTISIGLKAYREYVRINEEQSSSKYYVLVAPRHWVRPPQILPTTQCNPHYDPEVLPNGWSAASDSNNCLTYPYRREWKVNDGNPGYLVTGMNTGYNINLIGSAKKWPETTSLEKSHPLVSEHDGWRVFDTGLKQDGEVNGYAAEREAYIFAPNGNVYALTCSDGILSRDNPCRDFEEILRLLPLVNPSEPYTGPTSCPTEVISGPASLAGGLRWESDAYHCYGASFPQEAQVVKRDGGLYASFAAPSMGTVKAWFSLDESVPAIPSFYDRTPSTLLRMVGHDPLTGDDVSALFELKEGTDTTALVAAAHAVTDSVRRSSTCTGGYDPDSLPWEWRGQYSSMLCLAQPYRLDLLGRDGIHFSYGTERISKAALKAEVASRGGKYTLKHGSGDWQIWATGPLAGNERHAYALSPDGRAYHLYCGDRYASNGHACVEFETVLSLLPGLNTDAIRTDDEPSPTF